MLKKLWEKMKAIAEGKATMDEATYAAQHKLMVDLDTRLKGVEDYLANTPNHIGKVYVPATIDETGDVTGAATTGAAPAGDQSGPAS